MLTIWLIGLFLSLLGVWLNKKARNVCDDFKPVFKVWSFIFCLILSIIPFMNIIVAIILLSHVILGVNTEEIQLDIKNNKLLKFLNKPVK